MIHGDPTVPLPFESPQEDVIEAECTSSPEKMNAERLYGIVLDALDLAETLHKTAELPETEILTERSFRGEIPYANTKGVLDSLPAELAVFGDHPNIIVRYTHTGEGRPVLTLELHLIDDETNDILGILELSRPGMSKLDTPFCYTTTIDGIPSEMLDEPVSTTDGSTPTGPPLGKNTVDAATVTRLINAILPRSIAVSSEGVTRGLDPNILDPQDADSARYIIETVTTQKPGLADFMYTYTITANDGRTYRVRTFEDNQECTKLLIELLGEYRYRGDKLEPEILWAADIEASRRSQAIEFPCENSPFGPESMQNEAELLRVLGSLKTTLS